MSTRPFLLRFAVPRTAAVNTRSLNIRYDTALDLTIMDGPNGPTPVVNLPNFAGTMTKKCDIEKGEDQKDSPRPLEYPTRPIGPTRPPRPIHGRSKAP